jgi:hypothetical protein
MKTVVPITFDCSFCAKKTRAVFTDSYQFLWTTPTCPAVQWKRGLKTYRYYFCASCYDEWNTWLLAKQTKAKQKYKEYKKRTK